MTTTSRISALEIARALTMASASMGSANASGPSSALLAKPADAQVVAPITAGVVPTVSVNVIQDGAICPPTTVLGGPSSNVPNVNMDDAIIPPGNASVKKDMKGKRVIRLSVPNTATMKVAVWMVFATVIQDSLT